MTKNEVILNAREQFEKYFKYGQVVEDIFRYCYGRGYDEGMSNIAMMAAQDVTAQEDAAYQQGLDDAWDAAREFINMNWEQRHLVLKDKEGQPYPKYLSLYAVFEDVKAEEMMNMLAEYKSCLQTNKEKFEEVFGDVEAFHTAVPEELREQMKALWDWWEQPYKEP